MKLSFIIPCYRSENTLENVVSEIQKVMKQKPVYAYEIILVNDCSPDNVFEVQRRLAKSDKRIKVISLAKNRGKASAVLSGMGKMSGDAAVLLDDDGQCPIDQLWKLVEKIESGYDVAVAQYSKRKGSFIKNIGSEFNDYLMKKLLDEPDGIRFSNFNIRRRFVCDEMVQYAYSYPNLQGLTLRVTHNIALVPMEERERTAGKSGYTVWKSAMLLLDGCTGFSVKPIQLVMVCGIIVMVIGIIISGIVGGIFVTHENYYGGYMMILFALLMIGCSGMLLIGLIGEYIGRIYMCINHAPQYVIRDEINFDEKM